MEIKTYFKAPKGYVYVHNTLPLFGEIIYSTDEVRYKRDDFKLVTNKTLQNILEEWKLGGK
jgi:hypothetical protein